MLRLVVDDAVCDEAGDDTPVKQPHRDLPSDTSEAETLHKPHKKRPGIVRREIDESASIDGPVQESAEEPAADEPGAIAAVDLGVLEALLFSTHHPLTAGKLAELMEL